MAWRIEKHVVRGLIQNIVPGRVVGTVWLKGLNQPIELNLKGNCYRDIAGARLEFTNPNAVKGDYSGLDFYQDGRVGDMTASKKVKSLKDPDNFVYKSGQPIEFTWANCIYLEWFSESNGRVLIESVDYKWKVSLPKWTPSEEEEEDQQESNMQAMFNFMDEISNAFETDAEPDENPDEEMNEFQWEAYLQKSDARSDMLLELFEKYQSDPECEDIISEAMGWDIESIEVTDEIYEEFLEELEDVEENDLSEENDYTPKHPIISKMIGITSVLYFEAESRKLLTGENSNPWNQLVWHGQMAVGKLIAALDHASDDFQPEPGFIVATLKRALHLVHLTIATLEACTSLDIEHRKWSADIRKDLFATRESVLNLMQSYRLKGEK